MNNSVLMQQHAHYLAVRKRLTAGRVPVKPAPVRQPQGRDLGEQHDSHVRARNVGLQHDSHVHQRAIFKCGLNLMSVPRRILSEVSKRHGIDTKTILSDSRIVPHVLARHELFWRLREETNLSTTAVARFCGGRDHTTVLNGVRRHQARIDAKEGKANV